MGVWRAGGKRRGPFSLSFYHPFSFSWFLFSFVFSFGSIHEFLNCDIENLAIFPEI